MRLMLRNTLCLLIAVLTVCAVAPRVARAQQSGGACTGSLTIANCIGIPTTGFPIGDPQTLVAQKFVATTTGVLEFVHLFLTANTGSGDVVVEIRSVSGGSPTATVLATATITGIAGQSWYVADFSSANLALVTGSSYAIVPTATNSAIVDWENSDGAPCRGANGVEEMMTSIDGGTNWSVHPTIDKWFIVCLTPTAPDCVSAAECKATNYQITGINMRGQLFTPQLNGVLSEIRLLLSRGQTAVDATVEIRTTASGLPTSTVLATATIQGIDNINWYSADFSNANLSLNTSTTYAIVPSVNNGDGGWFRDAVEPCRGTLGSGAAVVFDGQSWSEDDAYDHYFEVCLQGQVAVEDRSWSIVKDLYR